MKMLRIFSLSAQHSPIVYRAPSVTIFSKSICDGCNSVIEHGRLVNVLGVLWHPECFCCNACHKPIAIDEVKSHVSNSRGNFHESCYREHCYVCKANIHSTAEGIEYTEHPFWLEKYCASHEIDGTAKCCSLCELSRGAVAGSILADEMMHAWLGINGHRNLEPPQFEQGICDLLAHRWLDYHAYSPTNGAAGSSFFSPTPVDPTDQPFEKKLVQFSKYHIEKDDSTLLDSKDLTSWSQIPASMKP